MSTTEILIAVVIVLVAGLAASLHFHRRRTGKLRERFGGAEYGFHLQPLVTADRKRFEATWGAIQSRFLDGPGGSVSDADRLLLDVMSARGYPVSDFAQDAAALSVEHPLVMKNYRAAHGIALQQARGEASTEDLRQAMIHYRTLFGELINASEAA